MVLSNAFVSLRSKKTVMTKHTLILLAIILLSANACKQDTSNQTEETKETVVDTTATANNSPNPRQSYVEAGLNRYISQRAGLRFNYPTGSVVVDEGNLITVKYPAAAEGSPCAPSSLQIVTEENCTELAFSETGGASVKTTAGQEKFGLYEFIKGYGELNGEKAYSYKTRQGNKCFTLTFFGNCALEEEGVLKGSQTEDIVRTFRVEK